MKWFVIFSILLITACSNPDDLVVSENFNELQKPFDSNLLLSISYEKSFPEGEFYRYDIFRDVE